MKLYYTPGACSLAPHIALNEIGADYDLIKVDLQNKQTEQGDDFRQVNPLGKVPALDIGEDRALTENPAILQYIADRKPEAGLAPPAGSSQRYRLQSALSYLGSEVHKSFVPMFAPGSTDDAKAAATDTINQHFARLNEKLSKQDYLLGDQYSVADSYLFVILGWPQHVGLDISKYPALGAYAGRIAQRQAVQDALKEEGLA